MVTPYIPQTSSTSISFIFSGRFGWTVLGTGCLPCLIRRESEPYICVRIAESTVLQHYLRYFNAEVFTCITIPSYNITRSEAELLNSINEDHCSGVFGKTTFSTDKDLVVKLDDLRRFHNFIEVCFNKLNKSKKTGSMNKCGFIRIDRDSVVPFVRKDELQFVPLFYFEGEVDTLQPSAITVENWDLAFLKFCCKIHGISHELFEKDQCQVVPIDCIKTYFPSDTLFEDYWPSQIVNTVKSVNSRNGTMSWIKKPPGMVSTQSTIPANASRLLNHRNDAVSSVNVPAYPPTYSNPNSVNPTNNSTSAKAVAYHPDTAAIRAALSKPLRNPVRICG